MKRRVGLSARHGRVLRQPGLRPIICATPHGLIGFRAAEREKRIADALDRVGLADQADKRVSTFSRGMRQRLGLAEILMKGAQIAILDEPTSGLDPHATTELPRHHPGLQE